MKAKQKMTLEQSEATNELANRNSSIREGSGKQLEKMRRGNKI
jgi:hypothetical protein